MVCVRVKKADGDERMSKKKGRDIERREILKQRKQS
jgi:hypothetical protein